MVPKGCARITDMGKYIIERNRKMRYEKNIQILKQLVEEHAFIIPIEKHRNKAGRL